MSITDSATIKRVTHRREINPCTYVTHVTMFLPAIVLHSLFRYFLVNPEETFLQYYMQSDMCNKLESRLEPAELCMNSTENKLH